MTHATPSELRLDNQICFAVHSAAHAFAQAYKPHLDPLGLTYPQYLALLCLWEEDGLTVNALGRRLHLDSGTLTPLLKRMEVAGWLTRTRDTTDERRVIVALTQKGRDLREPARAIPEAMLCSSGMSLEELQNLRVEVSALGDRLRRLQA
jgi:DNA-binding MarR family transcriptional regulator